MAPSPMGAGAAPPAVSGVPVALIKEAVQAAMQREAEKQAEAREPEGEEGEEGEEDAEDKDKDGKPDAEEEKDGDGDGEPDADGGENVEADRTHTPMAAAGGVDGGRAPVHIQMDVDTEQLPTPMTVTVDRGNPIGSQPASAT
jgi:hypothetical protein